MNSLKDLKFDDKNANKGTERGYSVLQKSIEKYGLGRSILIDKNGKIIAGNKTAEMAGQIGIENIEVVKSDGKKIIAVQRTDLDLDKDENARELAYADNRVGQLDLEWNADQIISDVMSGIKVPGFSEKELSAMFMSKLDIDDDNEIEEIKMEESVEYEWFVIGIDKKKMADAAKDLTNLTRHKFIVCENCNDSPIG